jgi:hypothetical protein
MLSLVAFPAPACDAPAMGLPDRAELLALVDRNMVAMYGADTRATPGGCVHEVPGLVLCRTPRGTLGTNMVMVTGPTDAAAVLRESEQFYRAGGHPFSVWTREHADARLDEDLRRRGFVEIHREPGMVLAPDARGPNRARAELRIAPVRDDAGRRALAQVVAAAFALYGTPEESTEEHFATLAGVTSPTTQAFLARAGERAVAAAILYLGHGVAGVGWVATLPSEFGRGFGSAITWAVVEEGFRRGARLASLQASPMGAPMYARMGFTVATHYRWFLAPG